MADREARIRAALQRPVSPGAAVASLVLVSVVLAAVLLVLGLSLAG